MSVDVPQLQRLAENAATRLAEYTRVDRGDGAQDVLASAIKDIESLFAALHDHPEIWRDVLPSSLERLEVTYGRALARVIASMGGTPLQTLEGGSTLVRLLVSDASARAALARLDPEADAETLETLFDLFVGERRSRASKKQGPRVDELLGEPSPAAHAALLALERAPYVIPSNPPLPPLEPQPPHVDASADQHVDSVHRVERVAKTHKH